jgi:hypothetical protein
MCRDCECIICMSAPYRWFLILCVTVQSPVVTIRTARFNSKKKLRVCVCCVIRQLFFPYRALIGWSFSWKHTAVDEVRSHFYCEGYFYLLVVLQWFTYKRLCSFSNHHLKNVFTSCSSKEVLLSWSCSSKSAGRRTATHLDPLLGGTRFSAPLPRVRIQK